jgi:hypothetical protein
VVLRDSTRPGTSRPPNRLVPAQSGMEVEGVWCLQMFRAAKKTYLFLSKTDRGSCLPHSQNTFFRKLEIVKNFSVLLRYVGILFNIGVYLVWIWDLSFGM